jgi:hypothetical protein
MSILRPFQWQYPDNAGSGYTVIPPTTNRDLQQYFHQLATKLKTFDVTINYDVSNRLQGYLKGRLQNIQKQQLRLIHKYMNEIERLLKLLTNVSNNSLNQTVRDEVQVSLNEITNELTQNLEDLKAKAQFINNLSKQNFHYYDAAECDLDKTQTANALEGILIKNDQHSRILCSNDTLNNNNPSMLKQLLHQLTEERKTNQNLRLIYADFSYSSIELFSMMILPSNKNKNRLKQISLSSSSSSLAACNVD